MAFNLIKNSFTKFAVKKDYIWCQITDNVKLELSKMVLALFSNALYLWQSFSMSIVIKFLVYGHLMTTDSHKNLGQQIMCSNISVVLTKSIE